MIIGKKAFTWDINQNYQATLEQVDNAMYRGEVREKTTDTLEIVIICNNCAEFYKWLSEHADQFEN